MNKVFVKICGITNYRDAESSFYYGADAIGFITWEKSRRYINTEEVNNIISDVNNHYPEKGKAGVFVNESIKKIHEYIYSGINIVQLHGNESPERVKRIKSELKNKYGNNNNGIQIWKAARLKDKEEIELLSQYDVDKILLDAYKPGHYGGIGKTADWELAELAVKKLKKTVILAGGLNPYNIKPAISKVKPFGVDLSSGIEYSPGKKNHKLMEEFFKQINGI
ncbi:MAG: phosphoribosylanthranilate isomerase [Victivallales bacterium]|nr:phosphoribosylanthranilate isomerase [Victivallales bacterium]MCF7888722.1 phosphoribosylanthranilate isomerase [Victivallales bacterium]